MTEQRPLLQSSIDTPLGPMALIHDADGRLWAAEFDDDGQRVAATIRRFLPDKIKATTTAPPVVADAFSAYFAGELTALDQLACGQVGSAFERAVWSELRRIPPGMTKSYGELARSLGKPGASRAVGIANSRNPLAVIVPCHRVIGANGKLTGYAGGLDRKEWLLRHEGSWPLQGNLL